MGWFPEDFRMRPTYTSEFIKSDTDRAVFLGSATADNLVTALTALSAEVWALRRRQKIVERLLHKHTAITAEMIETYVPTAEETAHWQSERDAFVKLMFDPFARAADIPYASSQRYDVGKER
jgi:hypothetical protein